MKPYQFNPDAALFFEMDIGTLLHIPLRETCYAFQFIPSEGSNSYELAWWSINHMKKLWEGI